MTAIQKFHSLSPGQKIRINNNVYTKCNLYDDNGFLLSESYQLHYLYELVILTNDWENEFTLVY